MSCSTFLIIIPVAVAIPAHSFIIQGWFENLIKSVYPFTYGLACSLLAAVWRWTLYSGFLGKSVKMFPCQILHQHAWKYVDTKLQLYLYFGSHICIYFYIPPISKDKNVYGHKNVLKYSVIARRAIKNRPESTRQSHLPQDKCFCVCGTCRRKAEDKSFLVCSRSLCKITLPIVFI